MFINEGITCDIGRHLKACLSSSLFTFLCLAVKCGVIDFDIAVYKHTVCGYFVTGLEKYQVTLNDIIHFDNIGCTVTDRLTLILFGIFLELDILLVAGYISLCRNKCYYQYSNYGTNRLIRFSITYESHYYHQYCYSQQYLDHRVTEGFKKLFQERRGLSLRYGIGAVFGA